MLLRRSEVDSLKIATWFANLWIDDIFVWSCEIRRNKKEKKRKCSTLILYFFSLYSFGCGGFFHADVVRWDKMWRWLFLFIGRKHGTTKMLFCFVFCLLIKLTHTHMCYRCLNTACDTDSVLIKLFFHAVKWCVFAFSKNGDFMWLFLGAEIEWSETRYHRWSSAGTRNDLHYFLKHRMATVYSLNSKKYNLHFFRITRLFIDCHALISAVLNYRIQNKKNFSLFHP